MGWELSLIVSVLGTVFVLMYLANTIKSESVWNKLLKFYLVIIGLVLLLSVAGFNFYILESNRYVNTTSTCTDPNNSSDVAQVITCSNVQEMHNVSYTTLHTQLITYTTIITWTFVTLIGGFMLSLLVYLGQVIVSLGNMRKKQP